MIDIRQLRRRKRITQIELANRVGVVPQSICAYEKGKIEPSVQVMKAIAKELDFVWWHYYETD